MRMSMLTCPLCGKMSPLYNYAPESFEDDILVQTVEGLGRGRGFQSVEARSIFDMTDSIMIERVLEKMCNRALEILQIMLDNDVISREELIERLRLVSEDR